MQTSNLSKFGSMQFEGLTPRESSPCSNDYRVNQQSLKDSTENRWTDAPRLLLSSRKMFNFLIMFKISSQISTSASHQSYFLTASNVVFYAQKNLIFSTSQRLTITLYKYRNKSLQRSFLTELNNATRNKKQMQV